MDIALAIMILSSGLFTGVAFTIAWNRLPAWRRMPLPEFKADFRRTIEVSDRMQPALLSIAALASMIFGLDTGGLPRMLAFAGAAGFIVVLIVSVAVLVPVQRQIIHEADLSPARVEALRARWITGHTGRTALSLLALVLVACAAAA